jgi:hypothetical protein
MPNPSPFTTTYAGEKAGKYISAALLSANTLENGGLTIMPNVKYKSVLKTFSMDGAVQDASCNFNDQATMSIGERYIVPKELQTNIQLCKSVFRQDWDALEMGFSAFDVLPKTFQDYMLAYAANLTAQTTETNLWTGSDLVDGEFDGVLTKLTAAGGFLDAGSGTVLDLTPSRVYGKEDLKLYVAPNVFRAYVRALGGFATGVGAAGVNNQGTQWYTGNANALTFDGVALFMANGLADDTILCSQTSNLYFGTGLLSDFNEIKLIDMSLIDGSQNVRVIMRYTAGTEIGFAGDIVTWGL